MGFAAGRVTFVRYRVSGDSPLPFGSDTLDQIEAHVIGRHATEAADGVSFGWSGGEHVLDTTLSLEKNILDDSLHLALRTDTDKIPSQLLQAYTRIELDARAAQNPSGRPSKAQREEAKEAARIRAEAESADGRFRRRRHDPILWDGQTNTLYAGTTSSAVLDRLVSLFRDTFGRTLEPVTAGTLAHQNQASADTLPTPFLGDDLALNALAWSSDPNLPDFLGNELLVWLWHTLKNDGDTVRLVDGTDLTVMLTKTLTLDCPRGENGRDRLSDIGPTRLPEAFKALQLGKLPRQAGISFERQGQLYEFTLQAESLAISGLSLPKAEGAFGRELKIARIEGLRHFVESFDLLFQSFFERRLGTHWPNDLGRIRAWLTAA